MRLRQLPLLLAAVPFFGAIACVAAFNLANAYERFDANALVIESRASLLVEEHDGLLAMLNAVEGENRLFQRAASALKTAYPRIVSITSGPGTENGLVAGNAGHYKLRASSGGRIIEMTIDAKGLLPEGSEDIVASLALPNGILLAGQIVSDPEFVAVLDSDSQPLVLSATPVPNWSSLLPFWPSLAAGTLALFFYFLAIVTWRQWQIARKAERRALEGENLARLEHASRINGLGEMASGIAHELTQPLTAILSQAQAGRRLLARGDLAVLEPVLDETILQTKRASAILSKLRQWVRVEGYQPAVVSVSGAVESVESLVRGDLTAGRCHFEQVHADPSLTVHADAVQLEQVIFNLVRNAMDAIEQDTGKIIVSTRREAGNAVIDVMDNGPGLDDQVKAHLFEPFVTSKTDGMGLGLTLCQRLVERMGGSLTYIDGAQTTFRVILPISRAAS